MKITMGKPLEKRITIVTGHYGSGKTEFAVNYALALAKAGKKTAIADLDIANPYFRSRERQTLMEEQGIAVYSNVYHYDITADMPAISAEIRSPLENPLVYTVVDAGGDSTGARILIQFGKYFSPHQAELLCVINANRPETGSFEGALSHIREIQEEVGMQVSGLVNNTHMLRETTPADILKGYRLSLELSRFLHIPILYTCCMESLLEDFTLLVEKERETFDTADEICIFPISELKMRQSWLDAPLRPPHRSPLI